jgi:hypothetical protein
MPPSPPRFPHERQNLNFGNEVGIGDAVTDLGSGEGGDSYDKKKGGDHVDFLQQTGSILALAEHMDDGDEEDDMDDLTAIMQELEALKKARAT